MKYGAYWEICACLALACACSNHDRPDSDAASAAPSQRSEALLSAGVSAEALLSTPVSIPLYSEAAGPLSISADANGFLVTWYDQRETRGVNSIPGAQVDVVATRVSNSGVVANTSGLFLSQGVVWDIEGQLVGKAHSAFNGQYYLVAWHQLKASATDAATFNLTDPSEIDAVRVSSTGELVDVAPFVVSALAAGDSSSVNAVLANGADFFVAWSGETSSGAPGPVQSRTLSFAGSEPVLGPVTTYSFTGKDPSKYAFISSGLGNVVAYVNSGNAGFTVGALSHNASEDCPAVNSPSIDSVAVGSNGAGELLVAYSGHVVPQLGPCKVGTKVVLIGADGLQKAPPILLSSSGAVPAVSYINGKYFVAGFQIDPTTNIASLATGFEPATVACNASACLGAVGSGVSRLSTAGVPLDNPPIAISTPARDQNQPVVTAGGDQYLAAWYEQTGDYDNREIRAGRLDANGAALDATSLQIAGQYSYITDVGFNGTDFVVAWLKTGDYSFRLSRISTAGVLKDPSGIVLPAVGRDAVMACASTGCLVAWTAGGITVSRIASDGTLLDSPSLNVAANATPGMLAYVNGAYVLEYYWSDQPIDSDHPAKIFLQKLDTTGHALGAAQLVAGRPQALRPCGSGYVTRTFVLVGNRFTWYASLLDSNAQVIQEKVDLGSLPIWEPIASASLASSCLIAWAGHGDSWDIYGKRLSPDDSALTSSLAPISADAYNEFGPALAAGSNGKVLAVYRHFIARPPYGTFRIAARLIDPVAFATGSGGTGGDSAGSAGSEPGAGTTSLGGSGGHSAGGTAGATTSGGSNSAGATGASAEAGEAGETNSGGSSGSTHAGGSPATGGTAADSGAGGVAANAGTEVGAGTADEGVAGAGTAGKGVAGTNGGHPAGGGGCALSPRRAPLRPALTLALMLIAFANWRRSSRPARRRSAAR